MFVPSDRLLRAPQRRLTPLRLWWPWAPTTNKFGFLYPCTVHSVPQSAQLLPCNFLERGWPWPWLWRVWRWPSGNHGVWRAEAGSSGGWGPGFSLLRSVIFYVFFSLNGPAPRRAQTTPALRHAWRHVSGRGKRCSMCCPCLATGSPAITRRASATPLPARTSRRRWYMAVAAYVGRSASLRGPPYGLRLRAPPGHLGHTRAPTQ